MNYSCYNLVLLFIVYSFVGWLMETIVATVKKKTFVNRGFFSSPFCCIYGFTGVIMAVVFGELRGKILPLFLGCISLATGIEWFAGKILERMNHQKWWDYSKKKWNFDGYICLQYSMLWGLLGSVAIRYTNRILIKCYSLLPRPIAVCILWVISVIIALDGILSIMTILHMKKRIPRFLVRWHRSLGHWTLRFGNWIVARVERRMMKAYPIATDRVSAQSLAEDPFAKGLSVTKLFWLFLIGAFAGDLIETIFCRFAMGRWMSRSSLVWGDFSIVWGLAIAMITTLLYKDRKKPSRHIFLVGVFLGGVYEYICSVFTELVFGKIFWDYKKIPLNIGGRINLLFCFFWGLAAVIWIKGLYPVLSRWIEKIPKKSGYVITIVLAFFMAVNMGVSTLALIRYDSRNAGKKATEEWEQVIDEYFNDKTMKEIYPKAKKPKLK